MEGRKEGMNPRRCGDAEEVESEELEKFTKAISPFFEYVLEVKAVHNGFIVRGYAWEFDTLEMEDALERQLGEKWHCFCARGSVETRTGVLDAKLHFTKVG
jgi:hypothetical protein